MLGISPRQVAYLTARGELATVRIGTRVLYSRAALEAFVEQLTVLPELPALSSTPPRRESRAPISRNRSGATSSHRPRRGAADGSRYAF